MKMENNENVALGVKMQNAYIMVKDVKNTETVTKSGIIIPRKKYQRLAKVVAVSENEKDIKVGDVIVKPIGRGTPVTIDGVEYECIKKDRLFAKL